MELIRPLTLIFWTFFSIYLICDYGEKVSNHFDEIHNELCQTKWYQFSNEMKQMLTLILISTQQPIIIQGFGNISLRRIIFKKVSFFEECCHIYHQLS